MEISEVQLEALKQYLAYRKQNQVEECLSMMSPEIVLVSQRDGTFRGHSELKQYLTNNPYQGTWDQPYWSETDDSIRVDGVVTIFFFDVSVKILIKLDQSNLIEHIYIGKA